MKLARAIEILTRAADSLPNCQDNIIIIAQRLSVEALHRMQAGRENGYAFFGHILPGETEDEPKTTFDPSISTVSTGEGRMP